MLMLFPAWLLGLRPRFWLFVFPPPGPPAGQEPPALHSVEVRSRYRLLIIVKTTNAAAIATTRDTKIFRVQYA